MRLDIFSESFYLANNPDVANAVAQGVFASGLDHFTRSGLAEGRISVSPLFDEAAYLSAYPDIAAAVAVGDFSSGLEHFIEFGANEGRGQFLSVFDEQAYLQTYPDIAALVASGQLASGYSHFLAAGRAEGRLDALFNEQFYLFRNPDVAQAIAQGRFRSGREHFLITGRNEGRTGAVLFDEGFYLRLYPDVANAVNQGSFSSGLEHFARLGEREGRQGSAFNSDGYLSADENADVAAAVARGDFSSGLQHFWEVGQFESSRLGAFTGTDGDDIVQSFGVNGNLVAGFNGSNSLSFKPPGLGEIDILIGSPEGIDVYMLGANDSILNPFSTTGSTLVLYDGNGDEDYALIRGFQRFQDAILLGGRSSEYRQTVVGSNLRVSTAAGDLIAIVEGVSSPLSSSVLPGAGNNFVLT